MDLTKNAARFCGFADVYDQARPHMPHKAIEIICRYLGSTPELAVDLGCGTGLSTQVWRGNCGRVIGVEPSGDMLAVARKKADDQISFIQAYAHQTGLPDTCADVVICSQSFHWMEPRETLREVDRILRPGGVFATVDCDWPPVTLWQAEQAYMALYDKVKTIERTSQEIKTTFVRYSKDEHLKNIRDSGYFRYARELVFSSTEKCTAKRFANLILSQGSLQAILKRSPEVIEEDVERFRRTVAELFGEGEFEIDFCYRMRVGIK